jgi:hypothetical protein
VNPRIERVDTSGKGLREFVSLPVALYSGDRFWVPQIGSIQLALLDPARGHPFHEHGETAYFLARGAGGRAVGRIAAIVNHRHNEFHGDRTGFFGFLEAEDDPSIFRALLDSAGDWLREKGMTSIRGPMNFSTNEEIGCLVDGFDSPPVLMMTYNPRYHAPGIEAAGLSKVKDVLAYYLDKDMIKWDRMKRLAGVVERRTGAVIRNVRREKLYEDVLVLMDVYNECWHANWGFVPMTDAEFRQMARDLGMLLVPALAPMAYEGDEAVAFAVALPDANRAFIRSGGSLVRSLLALKVPPFKVRIDFMRVLLLGVRERWRGCGLESLLIARLIEEGVRHGYHRGELSWVLEDNTALRKILERELDAHPYKTYRIFEKSL